MTVKNDVHSIKSKLKKGDSIIVVAGSRRGHIAEIEQVLSDGRFYIAGVVSKKNVKANPQRNIEGGIIEKLMPVDPSNVSLYNRVTKKSDRVAFKILSDGKKVRIYKKTQEMIDV
jgi:large subunit ribosomal protein L24